MKKISKLLLCLLLCLFVKLGVCLADDAGPRYVSVPALVSNSDGAVLYNYDDNYDHLSKTKTILPKGTEVTLTWSFEENGVTYYDIYYGDDEDFESGYIKLDDVAIVSTDKFLDEEYKGDDSYYVYDASKFVLREGPSEAYKKIDVTVSNGMTIKSDYNIYGIYARVNVNGTNGWLYLDGDLSVADVGKYVVKVDSNNMPTAYSSPNEKASLKTKLPIDKDIFTATYYCFSDNAYYGVEINGTVYWFLEDDVFDYYDDEYLVSIKNLNVYSDYEINENYSAFKNYTNKSYEYGDKISGVYYNNGICYIDGKIKGYVDCDYLYKDEIVDKSNYITTGTILVYKDTSFSEVLYSIPANEYVVLSTYYGISYMNTMIEYNGEVGWIEDYADLEYVDSIDEDRETETEVVETGDSEVNESSEEITLSPKQYVVLGVCVALIVALSSFVTIKCINKSKNVNIEQLNNKEKTE